MPRISEHVGIERKPKLGGGGPGKIPHRRGYGGGDDGDHGRPEDFLSRKDRLRRYRIAMVVTIVSVTTLFLGLTRVYFIRQGKGPWDPAQHAFIRDWQPLTLPYRLLFINTFVLLLSSVTLEIARRGLLR